MRISDWSSDVCSSDLVKRRISEVQLQKAKAHAERLKTDAEYKARHEERKQMPRSLGSFRERLPPWPLGARDKVDMDFRTACIKENGIQSLMRAQPELAAGSEEHTSELQSLMRISYAVSCLKKKNKQ